MGKPYATEPLGPRSGEARVRKLVGNQPLRDQLFTAFDRKPVALGPEAGTICRDNDMCRVCQPTMRT